MEDSAQNIFPAKTGEKNKFLFIVFSIVLLVIIGEALYFLFRNTQIGEKIASSIPPKIFLKSPEPATDFLKIAKKTLECLDKIRDEDGVYALGKKCDTNGLCKISAKDHRVGLNVLWGRTKYIEKTDDQVEMRILRKDLNLYLNDKKVKVVQPDLWSRKLLYDMWQSTIFSEKEKEKILRLAKKAELQELVEEGKARKKLFQEGYQTPDLTTLVSGGISKGVPKDEYEFNMMASFSGDYLSWSLWEKNPETLKLAKELLYRTAEAYFFSPGLPMDSKMLLGLTATDFYLATKEEGYLALARLIKEKTDFKTSCLFEKSCPSGLFLPTVTIMFYNNLYKISDFNKDFGKENLDREKIMNLLVSANWGKGLYGSEKPEDGCFFEANDIERFRTTRENGLLVGIFSQ